MDGPTFERPRGPIPLGPSAPGERRMLLSVVVPCMNEEEVLRQTHQHLVAVLEKSPATFEIIYVDDGSTDSTLEVLRELQASDGRVRVIRFSRNFGHQMAITAGLEHASGDAVVIIDADLQDPPEVILEFVGKWLDGYDVVYGVRTERDGESVFKQTSAKVFYRFFSHMSDTQMPLDTGDFRLMDRRVVDALISMPEQDRFVRGMVAWLGFRQTEVTFHRLERAAGETKYPLFKMVRLALNAALGFSDAPLRLAIWCGLVVSSLALLYGGWVLLLWISNDSSLIAGWSSTIVIVSLLCGMNMLMTGIVGLYVGRIHAEVKQRPLYVVQKRLGFERDEAATMRPAIRAVHE